jgi:OmpA-OmpF porin, OOP family
MKPFQIIFLLFLFLSSGHMNAQVRLGDKLKNQTNNRANKNVDEGINKGLDATEDKIKDIFKKKQPDEKPVEQTRDVQNQETEQASKSTQKDDPVLTAYSNYDFVPGENVLLFEDFSQDAVGDFPALWTTDVAGEINTLNIAPGNWFNLNSTEGTYWFMEDIEFPKNFILEMDIIPKKDGGRYAADVVLFGENSHSEMDKADHPGVCGLHIRIQKDIWETIGYKKGVHEYLKGSSAINAVEPEKVNHVILWVQNRRVRIYHKGAKVIDIPTNIYEGSKFSRLCFKLHRGASAGSYISNIKITTAAPDTRNKLLTEGKLVTYGIYFDVNKDVVKPESYGALNDIAKILKEASDVKVKIVGHTDSDGDDKLNLELSQRRAASVKNALVKDFGINAAMVETDGKGEGEPVASNDNSTNKALNRRVEFIKL